MEVTVIYSDGDEQMVVDDEMGEARPGYGFLFKRGPGSFTMDSMTNDDFKKMD